MPTPLHHRHNLHMHRLRSWDAIRQRAIEREVVITRVAVRDFDHGDQVGARTPQIGATGHSRRRCMYQWPFSSSGSSRRLSTAAGQTSVQYSEAVPAQQKYA